MAGIVHQKHCFVTRLSHLYASCLHGRGACAASGLLTAELWLRIKLQSAAEAGEHVWIGGVGPTHRRPSPGDWSSSEGASANTTRPLVTMAAAPGGSSSPSLPTSSCTQFVFRVPRRL